MEKEITALKSGLCSTNNEDTEKEATLHRTCISEIDMLKQLIAEEKTRAEGDKVTIDLDKKKISQLQIALRDEKHKTDEANKIADASKRKEEENKVLVEKLKKEATNFRLKWEVVNKMYEAERQMVTVLKRSADVEKASAIEQKRIAETNGKQLSDEICRANELSVELESEKVKVDKLRDELSAHKTASSSQLDETCKNLDAEREKVAVEKKRADLVIFEMEELKKASEISITKAMEEKARADKLSQDLQSSRQVIENLKQDLCKVNCEMEAERKAMAKEKACAVDSVKSQLEELRSDLELEKKKFAFAEKCANLEISIEEEQQKKVVEDLLEEKRRADRLSLDLQCSRRKIEDLELELKKVNSMLEAEKMALSEEKKGRDNLKLMLVENGKGVNENEKISLEEKCGGDYLFLQELENVRQNLKYMDEELFEDKQLRGFSSNVSSDFGLSEQIAKVKLFQEKLKFEEKRVNYFKELHIFGQDLHCLLQHVDDLTDSFGAINHLNKRQCLANVQSLQLPGSSPSQLDIGCDAEHIVSCSSSRDESCHLPPTEPGFFAGNHRESSSGMKFDLEPLLGGSHGEIFPSSALYSNPESFSDPSLGSQERAVCCLATSAGVAINSAGEQTMNPMWDDVERVDARTLQSIRPVHCVLGNLTKRRKSIDEVELINSMLSEGKRKFQEADSKFTTNRTLDLPVLKQMEMDNSALVDNNGDFCDSLDKPSKKRKLSHESHASLPQDGDVIVLMEMYGPKHLPVTINATVNFRPSQPVRADPIVFIEDGLTRFEKEMNGNYMKLLELDDAVAEERFRKAMEMPLSPTLPVLHVSEKAAELQTLGMPVSVSCRHACDATANSTDNKSQNFCIIFSYMEDVGSITRISSATRTCASRLTSSLQMNWVGKDVILALVAEIGVMKEGLRPREIICVIFSLFLLNFAGVSSARPVDSQSWDLLDTFSAHMKSVLLDKEISDIFKKICDLDGLLGLSMDFLIHRKILLLSRNFGEFGIEMLQLNENSVSASSNLIVAGSIILASISVVSGVIGSVYEASLKIILMCRADCASALLILHIFAYIAGDEYFTTNDYRSTVKAVKSFVTSVEASLAYNANMGLQQWDLTWPQFTQCDNCPFSHPFLCLEDLSSELFEELEECTKLSAESESFSFSLGAILSSLNLIAAKMSWDSVCSKVVAKLFQMLESFSSGGIGQVRRQLAKSKNDNVILNALILFLGDLGRLGAEAYGYEDGGVLQIKQQLLSFLCQTIALKGDDNITLTVFHALFRIYPNSHVLGKNCVELSAKCGNSAADPAAAKIVPDIIFYVGHKQASNLLSFVIPDTCL